MNEDEEQRRVNNMNAASLLSASLVHFQYFDLQYGISDVLIIIYIIILCTSMNASPLIEIYFELGNISLKILEFKGVYRDL